MKVGGFPLFLGGGLWTNVLLLCVLGLPMPVGLAAPETGVESPPPIVTALRAQLEAAASNGLQLDWARLRHFYDGRSFRAVWCDSSGPLPHAERLLQALRVTEEDGLVPADYAVPELRRLWSTRVPADLASLDLLLTDAFFRYSADMLSGHAATRRADPSWYVEPPAIEAEVLLTAAVDGRKFDNILRALPPGHEGYRRLREGLARYREIAQQGGWPELPEGPKLTRGDSDRRVALVRRHLLVTGDLTIAPKARSTVFDSALQAAVQRFQRRHGLSPDGTIGAATRAAFNVPVEKRIVQIAGNLDRWRWLPRQLGERYVMVNTAAFDLRVVDQGRTLMTMKVIVGRPDRPTPVLGSQLTHIVLHPYWHVPTRLAKLDLLPKQRRNPSYFTRQGIRVFRGSGPETIEVNPDAINWLAIRAANFPFRLRQDPGPENSLGRMKFMFPNPFAVYLHDTPSRRLFQEEVRTFSSGCVRIEQAEKFAAYLLALQGSRWTDEKLRAALESGKKRAVDLVKPIPIHLVYRTAWVDDDGTLNFRNDIYHRDEPGEDKSKMAGGCGTGSCISLN